MPDLIRRTLSSSCTPACDLLRLVDAGQLDYDEALRAFNDRLHVSRQFVTLHDAAKCERETMRYLDI